MPPYVRPSEFKDCTRLGANPRPEDAAEIKASSGLSVQAALLMGVLYSDNPLTIVDDVDDEIIAMFGVVPVDRSIQSGAVWLIASPRLMKHTFQFIRECRQWVNGLQENYEMLFNVVDERNEIHIRWLKFCGFKFIRRLPEHGIEKVPFIEFVRIKSDV